MAVCQNLKLNFIIYEISKLISSWQIQHRFSFLKEGADYIEALKNVFNDSPIYLSGNTRMISGLDLGKSVYWLRNLFDFEQSTHAIAYAS